MATPAEVAAAFHWLLGRAATADEAQAWAGVPEAAFRERLMATQAFAMALPSSAVRMRDERLAIELDVSPDVATGLLARVQAHWTRMGETMPHWSVAAQPAFVPDRSKAVAVRSWHPVRRMWVIL